MGGGDDCTFGVEGEVTNGGDCVVGDAGDVVLGIIGVSIDTTPIW